MLTRKEIIEKARRAWLSERIKILGIQFPNAEISTKTGYNDSLVSMYLSGKRNISVNFLRSFCEVYGIDYTACEKEVAALINNPIDNPAAKKLEKEEYNIVNELLSDESNDLSLPSTKKEENEMINRILGIMEQQNANMKIVAEAVLNATAASKETASTNNMLASIINRFSPPEKEGSETRKKEGVH